MLNRHALKSEGKRQLVLGDGDSPKIMPVGEARSGSVQEKEKTFLAEIIAKMNDVFGTDTTDGDQLFYMDSVKGKLLESDELRTQATNNTKAQFAHSPTLDDELVGAIIDAFTAHQALSRQALDSSKVREGLKDILLGPSQLYEALRGAAPEARV